MQKEKEDAVISVAMVTGSTQALCNLAYCIFGLFLALTHMLLPRASNRAVGCTVDPCCGCLLLSSAPGHHSPLGLAQQTATSMGPSPESQCV